MLFSLPYRDKKLERGLSENWNEMEIIILAPWSRACVQLRMSLPCYPDACHDVCSLSSEEIVFAIGKVHPSGYINSFHHLAVIFC